MAFSPEIEKRELRLIYDPEAAWITTRRSALVSSHRDRLSMRTIDGNSFNYILSIVRQMRPGRSGAWPCSGRNWSACGTVPAFGAVYILD